MLTPELEVQAARTRLMEDGEKEGYRPKETKQGKRKRRGTERKREMQQGLGGVDECVSPIVFSRFPPSNKSFKRGIRKKIKAKQRRGEQRVSQRTVQHCSKQFSTIIREEE